MKIKISAILASFAAAMIPLSAGAKETLAFDVPATWELKSADVKDDSFCYTIKQKEFPRAMLILGSWGPGKLKQIPEIIDELLQGYITAVKERADAKPIETEYKTGKLEGTSFSGRFVRFSLGNNIPKAGELITVLVVISDGDEIWIGTFTGTDETWATALEMLKKLKKKG